MDLPMQINRHHAIFFLQNIITYSSGDSIWREVQTSSSLMYYSIYKRGDCQPEASILEEYCKMLE